MSNAAATAARQAEQAMEIENCRQITTSLKVAKEYRSDPSACFDSPRSVSWCMSSEEARS